MSEATLLRACRDYLRMLPSCVAFRLNSGMAMRGKYPIQLAPPGAPDIIAVWHGRAIGIECKAATTVAKKYAGKRAQGAAQIVFQQAWEAAGGVYLLVLDLDDLIRWVEAQPAACPCARCRRAATR